MSSAFLLEDKFVVTAINKDGKYYTKVSRIDAKSQIYEIIMQLDINSEIFSMEKNKEYTVIITKSITGDIIEDKGVFSPDEMKKSNLLDEYQYAMYGKVFKVEEGKNEMLNFLENLINFVHKSVILASFGGLLMSLKGNAQYLKKIQNDIRIYLLIKAA